MIVAIVQARLGSNRLPGKALLPLGDRPMILHVLRRVAQTPGIMRVLLATTTEPEDDELTSVVHQAGHEVYRGHPTDVLSRFLAAGRIVNADVIIRVTGDCPLWSPQVGGAVLRAHLAEPRHRDGGVHDCRPYYTSNVPLGSPRCDGFDTEVFGIVALQIAAGLAMGPSEREHVTPAIRAAAWECRRYRYLPLPVGPTPKLSVDTREDYERVAAIFDQFHGHPPLAPDPIIAAAEPMEALSS